jgi:hypothetical protein
VLRYSLKNFVLKQFSKIPLLGLPSKGLLFFPYLNQTTRNLFLPKQSHDLFRHFFRREKRFRQFPRKILSSHRRVRPLGNDRVDVEQGLFLGQGLGEVDKERVDGSSPSSLN